ncbi:hypothetical protein [Kluyvera intermedia]|uniref:hypothetical protein n=1 Tax=Kluyvera intermedia TaxID=61648 RepID=UPI00370BA9A3
MEKNNDLKRNKGKYHKEALSAWHNMFYRVENYTQYTNVTICDEWHNYSYFYKWYSTNYVPEWDLDKDIKGGNEYSSDYCIFVPREVNLLFRRVGTIYGKGVVQNGKGYQAQITIDGKNEKLGTYTTINEASNAYMKAREERLAFLKSKYPMLATII